MDISGSVALVTGANGGIGSAFVANLLERGAAKIYIAARNTSSLGRLLESDGDRLVPMQLDVTNPEQIAAAVDMAGDVTLLVNNASVAAFQGVSLPAAATYSASKAAGLSLTRGIRAELAAQGTQVVGVLAVQTDTPMGVRLPEPRMTPQEVVGEILDAVQIGTNDEVVAGAQTRAVHQAFTANPKAVQARMSALLPTMG